MNQCSIHILIWTKSSWQSKNKCQHAIHKHACSYVDLYNIVSTSLRSAGLACSRKSQQSYVHSFFFHQVPGVMVVDGLITAVDHGLVCSLVYLNHSVRRHKVFAGELRQPEVGCWSEIPVLHPH